MDGSVKNRLMSGVVCLGWIVAVDDGTPVVDYPGNVHGPVPARVFTAGDATLWASAAAERLPVALAFCDGDPRQPLVLGVEQVSGVPREVEIRAGETLRLRCGEASITLRRDGKVVVRGVQVETRARGLNRIKGGAVRIN